MARRRYFKPQENVKNLPRINDQIRKSPIRLIDQNEEMIGVVDVRDAIERAKEADLDLVEVSPESDPPVCRILDFGKYRYEQSKKEKANRARSKSIETKEIRLGRSMKIDPHDIAIRLQQARKFLMDGHKVQIVQNFRGREMLHRERGRERMDHVIKTLEDISKVEMDPRMAGRRMSILLSPDKNKISQLQRQQAKEAASDPKGKEQASEPQNTPDPVSEADAPKESTES